MAESVAAVCRARPVTIVGSGFAAAAVILHLSKRGVPCKQMRVLGPAPLGVGHAYGCKCPYFRLNVRTDIQRIWPDEPMHFDQWAEQIIDDPDSAHPAGNFYRRADYGRYLSEQLHALPDFNDLDHRESLAQEVMAVDSGWMVQCEDGARYVTTHLIVATGNPEPQWPVPLESLETSGLVKNPWKGEWLDTLDPRARICLVGSGLTAMDAIHALDQIGHQGPIRVLAPHGLLPPRQVNWTPQHPLDWPHHLRGSSFVRFMRKALSGAGWTEIEWQERFEALRVNLSSAWQTLPLEDRRRLLRRLGWLWSLCRFRASPQTVESAERLQSRGQLRLVKGRMKYLRRTGRAWDIGYADQQNLEADVVVNCTGMGHDPLLTGMIQHNLIQALESSLSPRVNMQMQLFTRAGDTHQNLFCLGSATGLALGDIVGSTSIARQAARLSEALIADQTE